MNITAELRGDEAAIKFLLNAQKQVRFAASLACNDTARDVQQFTVNKLLPDKFTLRSRGAPWQRPGNKLGFNLTRSKPATLTAEVGSQAEWLDLQEKGGTKTAKGHRVAIAAQVRDTATSVIPRGRKPRRLLDRKQAFIIPTAKGDMVFERTGRSTLKLLYALKSSARVPARLAYAASGVPIADANFSGHFTLRYAAALATAR